MIRNALTITALIAALAATGWGWWQSGRRAVVQDELDAAKRRLWVTERQVEDARQAADVLDAHIKRMQSEQRQLDADLRRRREMEGYDAPLSDFLGDAFDRL
ncbi:hypothetical protein MACH17_26900 [Phaeobacter inhibens]|uniref:hypothetical protein n=1 Tax=Phaeobacter inhibens TaxID=221822 RepID=UPI00277477A0|nr:hypothetical protein [Phaeobacter inhibens]GLO71173.1 hypothetical protein MACH17_26900 [Phaeobacter inhibens]